MLRGQDKVKSLYRMWAETNQSIFFIESEEIAVADHYIASVATTSYQQASGKGLKQSKLLAHLPSAISHKIVEKALEAKGHKADDNDIYLYKTVGQQMIWPYDDRGRLIGEDVYEPEPSKAELFKLDPADVLTTEESAKLLAPFIKPLPSFDEYVLDKSQAVGRQRLALGLGGRCCANWNTTGSQPRPWLFDSEGRRALPRVIFFSRDTHKKKQKVGKLSQLKGTNP